MAADTLYLETGSTDPAYNLAFEEVVLQNRREGNTLLLWQNDHAVVIGQNQNAEGEINRAFVEAHQIHVVRRTTGGLHSTPASRSWFSCSPAAGRSSLA